MNAFVWPRFGRPLIESEALKSPSRVWNYAHFLSSRYLVMLRGLRSAGSARLRVGVRPAPLVGCHLLECRHKSSLSAESSKVDKDVKLRVDVRMLGNILGNIVKSSDPDVFNAVEKLREQARSWRDMENGNTAHFDEMVADIASYDTKKLKGVARAFTHFLALSNSAENHHRVRRIRARAMDSGKGLNDDILALIDLIVTNTITPRCYIHIPTNDLI